MIGIKGNNYSASTLKNPIKSDW